LAHVITIPFATLSGCVYTSYFKLLSQCRKLLSSKPGREKGFFFSKTLRKAVGSTQPIFCNGHVRGYQGVKGQGRKTEHPLPTTVEEE
jgi:hypothetical protein